ncbi:hypothetical protein ACIBHX_28805 [Nonomuraea sp. NPDC050536]|uniref:hypothetical protein n=1 Tax=Nonomuraea sp. NPDC050536 TaxID=3364366 RepID=UPI0037C7B8B1
MARIPQVRRVLFNDEEIGMGFNSDSGLAVGTALEGFTVSSDPVATGQTVTSTITIVSTHEELQETLGMSFEAQGRYGFFSASAKTTFSESSNYNSTSTFLVARVVVENALRRGRGFKVTGDAKALLDALRFDEFKRAFGDSFVRGLQTGGEFYAVIRITSVSVSHQTSLAATLQAEANGLVASGSFKASFEEANKSAGTRSEYTATMFQKAGSGAQISPTVEIGEVISRFKQFPAIASDSSAAYEAEVVTYDTLPLPVPTPEEQEAFLFALADARERKLGYIQTRNDLEFALRHPDFFRDPPSAEVLMAAISAYTRLINAAMQHAIKLSRGQISPPRLFDPGELVPPLTEPAPIRLVRVTADPTVQPATLRLVSLACRTASDPSPSTDEIMIRVDDVPLPGPFPVDMSAGDQLRLDNTFLLGSAAMKIQVWDLDGGLGDDDLIGTVTVTGAERGTGQKHVQLSDGQGVYELVYEVV